MDQVNQTYVFSIDAVKRAISNLTANPIHEHFAGYLAVLRAMRANGGQPATSEDIRNFYDRYLRPEAAPSERPYIQPFRSRGKGMQLFNPNVAGSYAPSSIRNTLMHVLNVSGSRRAARYELRPDHADAALHRLLKGTQVPAVSLAAFLYRDYGFELEEPAIAHVLTIFRDEFGLRPMEPAEHVVFSRLFVDDSFAFQDTDLERIGHE